MSQPEEATPIWGEELARSKRLRLYRDAKDAKTLALANGPIGENGTAYLILPELEPDVASYLALSLDEIEDVIGADGRLPEMKVRAYDRHDSATVEVQLTVDAPLFTSVTITVRITFSVGNLCLCIGHDQEGRKYGVTLRTGAK